jgi:peptide/nickel transport system permease protein
LSAQEKPIESGQPPASRRTPRWVRQLLHNRVGMLGIIIVAIVVVVAIFAPFLTPHAPNLAEMPMRLKPPGTPGHLLGTDQLGRDILSRIIVGSRISLGVALYAVVVSGVIGIAVGVIAGYYGGWIDTIAMRLVDVQLSFPFILLALVLNAILGAGYKNLIITLVISSWVSYARLARGEVLAIREKEYVTAARAVGMTPLRIMFRHILPNIWTPVIVLGSLNMAQLIVAEAAISFLGFGVQPPDISWGNMLADGRDYLVNAWWLATFPGLALAFASLGVNLTGDWLRDTLDPTIRL